MPPFANVRSSRQQNENPGGESGSYAQILKATSVIGGATGINYLIGLVKTKLVALLLGPSGVGLVGLYSSITNLVGALSGLGIASSGVREIAEAYGSKDEVRIAHAVMVLRRVSWVTGLLGWGITVVLAYPLSIWAFDSPARAGAVAVLGVVTLIESIWKGQKALVQGTRRIGDLARLNILGVLSATILAIGLYAWLGEVGIIPVLIASAIANLGFSWLFARRIQVTFIRQSPKQTWLKSKCLLGLGLAFMWTGLLASGAELAIRSMIVRELGLDAGGIYQSAWAISGMFAGFILSAMGADFYPQLTSCSSDHEQMNRLVNEQTEIGILLSLPGLLGTLTFAPWMMHLFYSAKFVSGAALLPWFVLGIFGRVVSWPLGFILLAKGAKRWFVTSETTGAVLSLTLAVGLLYRFGLVGTAIAYAVLYVYVTAIVHTISKRLTGFAWSDDSLRLLAISTGLVLVAFACNHWLAQIPALLAGSVVTTVASLFCLRGISIRLGSSHKLVKLATRIPGLAWICRS